MSKHFHVGVFYTQEQIKLSKKKKLTQFLAHWVETADLEESIKQLKLIKEGMEETYKTHPLGKHRASIMVMNKYKTTLYEDLLDKVAFLKSSGYNENLIYDYIFSLFLQYVTIQNQTESETLPCQI